MTTWNTLYDKIIVRRHAAQAEIAGIEVPEAHREKQNVGSVIAVGRGRPAGGGTLAPLTVEVGMEVLFNKFAGVTLDENEPDLLVLREDEILAYRKP